VKKKEVYRKNQKMTATNRMIIASPVRKSSRRRYKMKKMAIDRGVRNNNIESRRIERQPLTNTTPKRIKHTIDPCIINTSDSTSARNTQTIITPPPKCPPAHQDNNSNSNNHYFEDNDRKSSLHTIPLTVTVLTSSSLSSECSMPLANKNEFTCSDLLDSECNLIDDTECLVSPPSSSTAKRVSLLPSPGSKDQFVGCGTSSSSDSSWWNTRTQQQSLVEIKFSESYNPNAINNDIDEDSMDDTDDLSVDSKVDNWSSSSSSSKSSSCDSIQQKQQQHRRRINRREYSIQFKSHASVLYIPNRLWYTKKQRKRMWNGNKAIRQNAKRNKIEFEYENWDWLNVLEENEFIQQEDNGSPIHPAHQISE
jgi:hypothetical protein